MTKQAPIELSLLGCRPADFHRSSTNSWRGPCPECGGTRRFVVFDDKPWPHWYCLCDNCQLRGWADQINPALRQQPAYREPDLLDAAIQERAYQEEHRKREESRRAALAQFSTSELWKELHARMTDENRAWWRSQGIPDELQDFWRLGYTKERRFEYEGEIYTRPAYSIPKWDLGWKLLNCDYRLIDPPPGVGKYRPEPGLQPAPFLTRPDLPELSNTGRIIIVEGSKKAMVTCTNLPEMPQIAGVPSCNSWAGIVERVKEAKLESVTIILDPDAGAWARRMAEAVGPAARVVELPTKIDDAFTEYGLTTKTFLSLLKQATGRPM